MTLLTTPDSVEVNACCAPITSLLSRLTSAPVWVRVKNASDIRCTCSKTRVRMVKIRPSPIRDENQRPTRPSAVSTTARPAIATAIQTTADTVPPSEISLTTPPASSGVATPMTADTTVSNRNTMISRRNGRAKPSTRWKVPGAKVWSFNFSPWWAAPRIAHIA